MWGLCFFSWARILFTHKAKIRLFLFFYMKFQNQYFIFIWPKFFFGNYRIVIFCIFQVIVLSDRISYLKKKHYCLSSKMVVPLRKIIDYSEVHCYQRVRCSWMWLSMFIKRRYLKESVSVIFKLIWKHKKNVLQQWMLIKITWIMNGIFSNIPCQNIDWCHAVTQDT